MHTIRPSLTLAEQPRSTWLQTRPWNTVGWLVLTQVLIAVASLLTAAHTSFPAFNFDVFLVAFIPYLGALLGGISALLGAAVIVSEIFGYEYLAFSIPELAHNLPYFPTPLQLLVGGAVTAALIGLAGLAWHSQARRTVPSRLIGARSIWLILAAAVATEQFTGWNTSGSTFLTLRDQLFFFVKNVSEADSGLSFAPLPASHVQASIDKALQTRRDVVLIVVESLGEIRDARMQQQVDAALLTSATTSTHTVHKELTPFKGSTIHGEFRALCNADLRNQFFSDAPQGCAPERARQAGYVTTAMHGNDARFYRRHRWYPQVGLDDVVDIHRLPQADVKRCGGMWNAYCDLDLMDLLTAAPQGVAPRFDYALTINTHLPVHPMTRGKAKIADCRPTYPDDVCLHLENLQRVMTAIEGVTRARSDALVIVTGDHAPPFALEANKRLFHNHVVPTYILTPR